MAFDNMNVSQRVQQLYPSKLLYSAKIHTYPIHITHAKVFYSRQCMHFLIEIKNRDAKRIDIPLTE